MKKLEIDWISKKLIIRDGVDLSVIREAMRIIKKDDGWVVCKGMKLYPRDPSYVE